MGTAALDLPDPLQAPPEGPKGSTDDLLAQLAGDEIDRLLANADAGPATLSEARALAAPPGPAGQEIPPADNVKASAAATKVPPKLTEACQAISAELDALFNQVQSTSPEGRAAPAESSAGRSASEAVSAAAVQEAETELDAATTAAEREGLKPPAGVEPPSVAGVQLLAAPKIDDDAPLPFYLRPLEWLNAPLALFPESVRDLIGKAAIVTLLNAAAILAYVLVVRRGH